MCSSMKAVTRAWRSFTFAENSKIMLPFGQFCGQSSQRGSSGAEIAKTIVVRLTAMEPVKNLLDDHCELEYSQHFVVADVGHVASGALGVSRHELVAIEPPRQQRESWNTGGMYLRRGCPDP